VQLLLAGTMEPGQSEPVQGGAKKQKRSVSTVVAISYKTEEDHVSVFKVLLPLCHVCP